MAYAKAAWRRDKPAPGRSGIKSSPPPAVSFARNTCRRGAKRVNMALKLKYSAVFADYSRLSFVCGMPIGRQPGGLLWLGIDVA